MNRHLAIGKSLWSQESGWTIMARWLLARLPTRHKETYRARTTSSTQSARSGKTASMMKTSCWEKQCWMPSWEHQNWSRNRFRFLRYPLGSLGTLWREPAEWLRLARRSTSTTWQTTTIRWTRSLCAICLRRYGMVAIVTDAIDPRCFTRRVRQNYHWRRGW